MAHHTPHAYLRQFRHAADQRPQETFWQVKPMGTSRAELLRNLYAPVDGPHVTDSLVQDADLQRWNDDGGHGRQQGVHVRAIQSGK